MMILTKCPPNQKISNVIRFFWHLEGLNAQKDYIKILPFGALDIIIHKARPMLLGEGFKNNDEPQAFVEGQYMKYHYKRPSGHTRIVGISLQPWASEYLFGLPSLEFTGEIAPLEALTNSHQKLVDAVMEVDETKLIFELLNDYFLSFCADMPEDQNHDLLQFSHQLRSFESTSIKHIAANFWGGSMRKLQSDFLSVFGITMSDFRRKARFQNSISKLHDRDQNLTKIAHACGFFDQSHFNRSFNEFTGVNPKDYYNQLGTQQPLTVMGALTH